jgi:hypothetical protein
MRQDHLFSGSRPRWEKERRVTTAAAVDQAKLRGLGLSWRKAGTVLDLAQRFSDGRLAEAELRELPDQEVIRRLTEIKGIGAWTVPGVQACRAFRPAGRSGRPGVHAVCG